VGSWLEQPGGPGSGRAGEVPGARLGLPADGPGSIAGPGRRIAGIALDWVASLLVARAFLPGLGSFGPLVVLFVEHAVLVGTAGFSLGHRVAGLRVTTVAGAAPGLLRAAVRALLLVLAVPPLIWDADQRGLHDKAAGTMIVRL
jgi:uncharacterized RDD family membrane protein YckC